MNTAADILTYIAIGVWAAAAIWVSGTDIKRQIIPTKVVWPAALGVLICYIAAAIVGGNGENLLWAVLSGISCGSAFLTLYIISPKMMGGGDVRLVTLNGLLLGWYSIGSAWLAIAAAMVISFPVSLVLVIMKGRSATAAFGPFLAAGTAVILLWELL